MKTKKWAVILVLLGLSSVFQTSALSSEAKVKADNTAVNKRDLNKHELTAEDQSNEKADVEIARLIRREVTKQKGLSLYAKNIKIIVRGSDVTMKGPVHTKSEKAELVRIATTIAPNHRLHNQIVVTK